MIALATPGHQQRHPAAAQLAAWTVVKLADGDIRVSIIKLQDPAALQRKLRAEGVPASIVTSSGVRACSTPPAALC